MTTILVIEDEPQIRDDLCLILELEGYESHGAENGEAALPIIQQINPDLIVCDVKMPKLDGYGLLERLRQDAQTAQIVFVFFSARTSDDDVQRGLSAGASAYLTKPISSEDLLKTIRELLA